MKNITDIRIEEYSYDLPDERIAAYPLENRDDSKLLVYKNKTVTHSGFKNISSLIPEDSLLVFNNTKVIQARLLFKKPTGAKIEIFCLEPIKPSDHALMFQSREGCTWKCMVGNLKKWKDKTLEKEVQVNDITILLKVSKTETEQEYEFSWDNSKVTFSEILESEGIIPIPPYLSRETEELDLKRYQTIYSKNKGSVAAPTAGLHFTENVNASLKSKNISFDEVTLHVGAGTFKPVKSETIGDHEMHHETIVVSKENLQNLINHLGNITVVGTTSVRTLETLYWLGNKLINKELQSPEAFIINQWDAYNAPVQNDTAKSLQSLLDYMEAYNVEVLTGQTQIMIAPGYEFKITNRLITNFHQPGSTLLLLIAAFVGEDWKKIYDYAMNNEFRFLSYGDSSILF